MTTASNLFAILISTFFESWNKESFREHGIDANFVQDNQSLSSKGVIRGLHFQNPPFEQGKLVRVIKGAVIDVAVDIRKESPTYGQHVAIELNEENKTMFWIPPGFAHGFATLTKSVGILYKVTEYWDPDAEQIINYKDPELAISWPINNPVMSERDFKAPNLADVVVLPNYSSEAE